MRILAFSALALGLGLTGAQLAGCSNSADDCHATATCTTAGSSHAGKSGAGAKAGAGNDAGSNAGGTPSGGGGGGGQNTSGSLGSGGEAGGSANGCMGDVADDPTCFATNELGVFVSSDAGDDTNGNGTKEAPFASISKGIQASAGKNVYVCLGNADFYEEKLTLTELAGDGVHIYGGFECAGWTHSKTRYAGVRSPEPTALRVSGLQQGATIENVRFVAANGTEADPSSYGAFITDSKNVVLRRVEITAGAGMKGKDGDAGVKGENGAAAGAPPVGSDGCAVTASAGEWTIESSCGSQGGAGAKGLKAIANAPSGNPGIPTDHVHPLSDINNGGPGEDGVVASFDGKVGTAGDAGSVGAAPSEKGTFSGAGYQGADGKIGSNGYPGQGGGGGGASKGTSGTSACFGASGGAGGMGGCGGTAGRGGKGGGASVGLFSWNSEVVLESSKVTAGAGGAGGGGGKGGGGGAGADGGAGGVEDGVSGIKKGGRGGGGGTGGNGGSGSGGTGGPSYAIAYSGPKPTYEAPDTALVPGTGGDPGIGGQVLDAKAPNGSPGDSAEAFELQ